MSIGMTYEQYWYGDVHMVRAFLEAEKKKQIRENNFAWLQGAYVLQALDAIVGNAFRQKGSKAAEYPKEPIKINEDIVPSVHQDEVKAEQEEVFAKAYMMNMMRVGKDWGKH